MTEVSGYVFTETMNVCQIGQFTYPIGNATAFLVFDLRKMFIVGNQKVDIERLKSFDLNFTIGYPDVVSELQGERLTYYEGYREATQEAGRNIKLVAQSDEVRTFAKLVSQRVNSSEASTIFTIIIGNRNIELY